jgi:hypothetical protein
MISQRFNGIPLVFTLILLVLAACSPQPATAPEPSSDSAITSYTALLDGLRAQGITVEEAGAVEQPFFPVSGKLVRIGGQDVQVFEFAEAGDADAAAASIDASGSAVGTSMVTWMATPHFYRAGPMIVLYVGDDETVLEPLTSLLGAQIAGG